jgi:hypothetical protein
MKLGEELKRRLAYSVCLKFPEVGEVDLVVIHAFHEAAIFAETMSPLPYP